MAEKQIVVDDALINYIDLNPEASKALVFLHGWQSNAAVWNGVLEKLKNNPARLIAPDLPGFGKSPMPKQAWGVGEYAAMVKKLIEKQELKDVILVGHSFGGRVAIKLAAAHPEMVQKLVLVDAAGFRNEKIINKLKILAAKTVKPLFALPVLKQLKEAAYRAVGANDYAAAGPMRAIFVKTINEDLSGYLPKITAQTLLIWGGKDKETLLAFGQVMNRLIPNSKLVVLEGAGHFSFIDEPEKFTELIHGLL